MKVLKKTTSIILVFAFLLSVIIINNSTVNAATNGVTQEQAVEWAKAQASNPKDYDGAYGVQCVDLAVAYYKYLGERSPGGNGRDYATNSLPTGWARIQNYNGFIPEPGDIAVWTKTGSEYGHVAIVLSANTSSLTVSEFLGSNHTARTHTYSYSYGTFYGVIRPDFPKSYIDIGDNFYGCIVNPSTGYRLTNSNTNVTLNSADNVMSQVWKFERQSDTSYRICSLADGTFLDAQDAKCDDNTNVQTYVEHDTAAQRWYFCDKQNRQYSIRSCLGEAMIDVHTSGGVIENGANVQLYHRTGASEQIYKVQKIDDINSFLSVNVGDNFYGSVVNPSTGYRLTNSDNNAIISSLENKASQIWRFERQTDNSYRIISIADNTQLDAHDSSTDDGNNIQTYAQHDGATQRWYFYKISNNRYMLRSSLGMAVMDIHTSAGNVENGANLQLYHITGSSEQIYSIEKVSDIGKSLSQDMGTDFYAYITNTHSGLRLTNSDNNVTVNSSNNNSNQIWKFEKQSDDSYLIRSAYNDMCLDVENGKNDDATNIQINEDNGTASQRWFLHQNFSNEYSINSALGNSAVDIHTSGGTISNGANVQLYHMTGAYEQRYTIQKISNVNQIISADLGTDFYAYITNPSTSYKLTNSNSNVTVNSSNNSPYQIWKFEKQSDNRYLVRSVWDNKCLDAQGGKYADNTNVQVYQDNGQTPQRWYFCKKADDAYTIKTALGDTVLDAHTNGEVIDNGANIQLYHPNGAEAQLYKVDKIGTKAIATCAITINPTSYIYDGTAKQPSITVKDGSTTLTNGTHYSVSCSGNTNAGTGTVTITGIGYYTGTATKTFTISSKTISSTKVTLDKNYYVYDGTEKRPSVAVTDGSKVLTAGVDYTVNYESNVEAGTARVIISGKNNYSGNAESTFVIISRACIGDANNDGKINIRDVTAIQRHVCELELLDDRQLTIADTNGDGVVNINDATRLQMYLAEYDVALGKKI